METYSYDLIIRNGRVIDPMQNIDDICDVAIKDGKIAEIGKNLSNRGKQEFEANDCLVVPGLIDCHVHVYEHCTQLGVNADSQCLARGKQLPYARDINTLLN